MIFSEAERPLPWRSNGSRDLIAQELLREPGRFRRVPLGGRPTELAFGPDGKTLYVANYLSDSIQVVDVEAGRPQAARSRSGRAGGAVAGTSGRGAVPRRDPRSFNQWYSCNTCHSDGHTNGADFDTLQRRLAGPQPDPPVLSRKKVPTLRRVALTGPWTWHGWQGRGWKTRWVESFTKSMQGKAPKGEEVDALISYLKTLDFPRNPNRPADGPLSPAAERGRAGLSLSQGLVQLLPRRRRADRRQDPLRRPGVLSRRLQGLQPALAPGRLRQGALSPRRPSQDAPRGPRKGPQPGRGERPGGARRGRG